MMKKLRFISFISIFVLIIGCSAIENTTNTINYIKEASDYAITVSDFYQNVPGLIQQAASDPQAKEELDQKIMEMKEAIESFNELEVPPDPMAHYHEIIVGHNEQLLSIIDSYIESGMDDVDILTNADLIQAMKDISSAIEDIKNIPNGDTN